MNAPELEVRWLGRVAYEEALELQDHLWQQRLDGQIPDTLLLLDHEPVYTIGRTQDRSSLPTNLDQLPYPLVEISRGGQATYHGPGQLVGYGIVNLRHYGQDLHAYLRALEQSVIDVCATLGLSTTRREGLTGVWCEDRKLASIGVGVRQWTTMHGFALNVEHDVSAFDAITPCGIEEVTMTSLAREMRNEDLSVNEVADEYPQHLVSALQSLG